jgi:CheY-like chemotaxis protein
MTGAGFEIKVAVNGQEAVEQFQSWQPDFIWMDMRMPVMDGYAATRLIRALPGGKSLPIVALTASAFEEDRVEILAAGCTDMVRKPMEADFLFETLAHQLGVTFIYAEGAASAGEEPPAMSGIAEALLALPEALRQRLYRAAEALDALTIREIASEIEAAHPHSARIIQQLAASYRFDLLRQTQFDDAPV